MEYSITEYLKRLVINQIQNLILHEIIDIYVEYILLFIMRKVFNEVDIWCCYYSSFIIYV